MARTSGHRSSRVDPESERLQIRERYRLWRTIVRSAAVVGGLYVLLPALTSLSGQETILTLSLSILGDFKFVASVTLAGAAVAWAAVERWLRQRKVESLQARIRELETFIDPNRSSSGLTTKGKTNPRDDGP